MNAVVVETASRPQMTGLEYSYVNAKLNAWGHWMERHAEVNGYPRRDNITAYLEGAGGGQGRDRILCTDFRDEEIAKTHLKVLYSMTDAQREAVYLYYVIRMKPDGTLWTLEERLEMAGISKQAFWQRIRAARMRYLGLDPNG